MTIKQCMQSAHTVPCTELRVQEVVLSKTAISEKPLSHSFSGARTGKIKRYKQRMKKRKFREIMQNRKSSQEPLFVIGRGKRRHRSGPRPTRFLPQNWKRKYRRVCTEINKLGGAALSPRSWEGGAGATPGRARIPAGCAG